MQHGSATRGGDTLIHASTRTCSENVTRAKDLDRRGAERGAGPAASFRAGLGPPLPRGWRSLHGGRGSGPAGRVLSAPRARAETELGERRPGRVPSPRVWHTVPARDPQQRQEQVPVLFSRDTMLCRGQKRSSGAETCLCVTRRSARARLPLKARTAWRGVAVPGCRPRTVQRAPSVTLV